MLQGKTLVIVLAALVVGFVGGLILRPVLVPPSSAEVSPVAEAATSAEARAMQYFIAHVEEARQVVAGCRDGSVRGGECTNAEEAIIKVDAAERRKRFLGN